MTREELTTMYPCRICFRVSCESAGCQKINSSLNVHSTTTQLLACQSHIKRIVDGAITASVVASQATPSSSSVSSMDYRSHRSSGSLEKVTVPMYRPTKSLKCRLIDGLLNVLIICYFAISLAVYVNMWLERKIG